MNSPSSEHPTLLYMSLVKDTLQPSFDSVETVLDHCLENSHCALWLQSGSVVINETPLLAGQGEYFSIADTIATESDEAAVVFRFICSTMPLTELINTSDENGLSEVIYSQQINVASAEVILRLDQIDFPPGAIAYKHTHPGPGIRYLFDGGLTLSSDHGDQEIKSGEAWFEAENSAVKATAISTGPSGFVRAMLLPLEYEGRSTFTLHDQADASKPRLQTNIRHFEQRISLNNKH